MKPLTIEINGTGTHNRGAELMAIAASQRIRASFPDARIVVSSCFGKPSDIEKYGLARTWEHRGFVRGKIKTAISYMLSRLQRNVVEPIEVDVVLDASGFAFSDQWGEKRARRETKVLLHPSRRHQMLIMLPQALGPFENPGVAEHARKLFERAKLICARDTQSLLSVQRLQDYPQLRQYPDFTVGVAPGSAAGKGLPDKYCAIVPNYRMLDKGKSAAEYLDFLRHAIASMVSQNMVPAFVLHDASEDRRVIEKLGSEYAHFPVFTDSDPRILKAMLGKAEFVIGSRFHALVSALSQGVPCIGAGWSHKYPELFRDFDCPELLAPDLADLASLDQIISILSATESRKPLTERISTAGAKLKQRSNEMWAEVESLIRTVDNQKA